jgi:SP family arabinose:H+ symporter-like MFS transporter
MSALDAIQPSDFSIEKTKRINLFISFSAAMAGLLFGLDIGVIAGALPFITHHFSLSSRLQEWVVSTMMLGAALGALANGGLSSRLGRKYSLLAAAMMFIIGSLGSALAIDINILMLPIPRRCIYRKWRLKPIVAK